MDDLVQWLRAALDGEAEEARTVAAATEAHWSPGGEHLSDSVNEAESGAPVVVGTYEYLDWPVRQFIAAHDPARVLREIEAKRAIVAAYLPPGGDPHPGLPCINYEGQDPADYSGHDACSRHLEASKRLLHDDYVLRILALPYENRPGFQESWRP